MVTTLVEEFADDLKYDAIASLEETIDLLVGEKRKFQEKYAEQGEIATKFTNFIVANGSRIPKHKLNGYYADVADISTVHNEFYHRNIYSDFSMNKDAHKRLRRLKKGPSLLDRIVNRVVA